jgi:oligopeptide transport system substrate-binding protein
MDVERKNRSDAHDPKIGRSCSSRLILVLTCTFALISISCTQLEKPEPEPFFAQTAPPAAQEFRWSNGRLPKSLDPALASAPPETDVVRAVYEGLTETDPATLVEVAGVAESWSSSEDFKLWTFKLRRNAKWNNGKPVTASDFVRAWKRLVKLGDKAAHRNLLSNIVGAPRQAPDAQAATTDAAEQLLRSNSNQSVIAPPVQRLGQIAGNSNAKPVGVPRESNSNTASPGAAGETASFGAVAEDDLTLKVSLVLPDKEFPRLVANPIFRPIFNNGEEFIGKDLNPNIVTNGPFRIGQVDQNGIVLERSANYWNRDSIRLDRVHMVAMESPEKALAAYRAGELDAITNADLSPLVLKLLSPYEDFRKTTHSALNFYEVNATKLPFSDRRVREALSNALERDRLTEGEMDGMTRPALGFLPYSTTSKAKLTQDKEKARELLDEAGFPDGEGFPVIRLLVNRNETQQRVAKSVAKMWKQNLNLETEIVVKDAPELERSRAAGDFDLVRRGVVFPTSDQTANFMAIFEPKPRAAVDPTTVASAQLSAAAPTPGQTEGKPQPVPGGGEGIDQSKFVEPVILTEEDAIYELRAIPLYFPTSFSLVKPYVAGFETNSLDAITLTNVAINSEWRPKDQ